jgi:hypothetical protein
MLFAGWDTHVAFEDFSCWIVCAVAVLNVFCHAYTSFDSHIASVNDCLTLNMKALRLFGWSPTRTSTSHKSERTHTHNKQVWTTTTTSYNKIPPTSTPVKQVL